jgi:hypothetical protein
MLDTCFLENIKTGEATTLSMDEPTTYFIEKHARYSVFCEMNTKAGAKLDSVEFTYDNGSIIYTDRNKPYYMAGKDQAGKIQKVDYLTKHCGSVKTVQIVGTVGSTKCFRASFVLTSVCA